MSHLKHMPDRCPHCGQIENKAPATAGLLRWFVTLCIGLLFLFLTIRANAIEGITGLACMGALIVIGSVIMWQVFTFGIPGPMSDEAFEREDEAL